MYEWSKEHEAIIAVMRRFVDEEVRPHLDELEHHGVPPYGVLRTMFDTFGLKDAARERFERLLARKVAGDGAAEESRTRDPALTIIPTIELSRVEPRTGDEPWRVDRSCRRHDQSARYARSDAPMGA